MFERIMSIFVIIIIIIFTVLSFSTDWVNQYLLQTTFIGLLFLTIITSFFPQALSTLKSTVVGFKKKKILNEIMEEYNKSMSDSKTLDEQKVKNLFLKLYQNKKINSHFIEKLSDQEAAVFLLGLQTNYQTLKMDSGLSTSHITNLASKASNYKNYIQLVTNSSINTFYDKNMKSLSDEILQEGRYLPVVDNALISDENFYNKLGKTSNERIFVFSTTSQISSMSLNLMDANADKIQEVNLFLVSPNIESDSALLRLETEYEVPGFAMPRFQFAKSKEIDMIRRVIKILSAIENTMLFSNQTEIEVNLYLFKSYYPELKIRLLESRNYLQLFPSSLNYANNLYRFGIEVHHKDLIENITDRIKEITTNDQLVKKVKLDKFNVQEIKEQALKECAVYLFKSGFDINKLNESRADLKLITKDANVDKHLDDIIMLIKGFQNNFQNIIVKGKTFDQNERIYSETKLDLSKTLVFSNNRELTHLSVGIIISTENDDEILLIRKKKKPYTDKYSIVAGHLEEGETPKEAIEREVKEEIGIQLDSYDLILENFTIQNDICRHGIRNHIWFVYRAIIDKDTELVPSKDEILNLEWKNKKEIKHIDSYTYAANKVLERLGYFE